MYQDPFKEVPLKKEDIQITDETIPTPEDLIKTAKSEIGKLTKDKRLQKQTLNETLTQDNLRKLKTLDRLYKKLESRIVRK